MDFDDILAQAGSVRDLLVLLPGHDQGHDLPLTRGQGLEPRLQIGSKPGLFPPSTIAFDPSLDGIEKVAVDLRTLAAVVLLHTLTVVGPLVSLATRAF